MKLSGLSCDQVLSASDIDATVRRYLKSIADVGRSLREQRGLELLSALKRDEVGCGPYPNVTLFEAANRIMTDLVKLHGVRWLLKHEVLPFRRYTVDYGHGNESAHDIEASEGGKLLIGEVFNVAPSLFAMKKAKSLKKLRGSKSRADYRAILVNHDAVATSYVPKPGAGEHYVFVNVGTGECRVVAGPDAVRELG